MERHRIMSPNGDGTVMEHIPLPPPDPDHPKRIYDTFFASVASIVEQHANKRVLVRDRLICHLGSIVFGIRFERGNDVYQMASSARGRNALVKRLNHAPTADRLFAHYAIKTLIKHRGAYIGCHADARGGKTLGTRSRTWRKHPHAMAHAVSRFVWDNLGDIPSATRQGRAPIHKHTRTTCVDVFLYLLVDLYPAWRPMLYRRHETWTEFCPNFNLYTSNDTVRLRDNWRNNASPLYLHHDARGQFCIMQPSAAHCHHDPGGLASSSSSSSALSLARTKRFRLRRYDPGTHTNVRQPCFDRVPNNTRVYALDTADLTLSDACIYMVTPAKDSQRAFDVSANERLFIYAMRPTQSVWQHYQTHCIEYRWQAPGKASLDNDKTPLNNDNERPDWLPRDGSTHVFIYTSHESRTGIWPTFKLVPDTTRLVIVIADTRDAAEKQLHQYNPDTPLISLPDDATC